MTLNEVVNGHADDLARELCRMDNAVCEIHLSGVPIEQARMEVLIREVAEIRLRVIRMERELRKE